MSQTFANAVTFNQDLSNWDVSQVTSMPEMFQSATAFHQVVSDWNVSNVLDMTQHVLGCSARFDHSLYEWQDLLNSETQVTGMLDGSACLDGVPDSVSRVDKQCLRKSHCCEHLLVTNLLPLIMHSCKALMLKPKERKTQTGKRTCIQHSKSRWW